MNPTGATYAGKLALITGSRRGVGRLVAEHILQGRPRGRLCARRVNDRPSRLPSLPVDIGDPALCRGFAALKKVTMRAYRDQQRCRADLAVRDDHAARAGAGHD
jgi:3-oxoacyl-[acyl-carrier protein] reductase